MRRLKTGRRPPIYPKTPGHLPCSSLTHPLPLSSRRPSVSFGGFGLKRRWTSASVYLFLDTDEAGASDRLIMELSKRGVLRGRYSPKRARWVDGRYEKLELRKPIVMNGGMCSSFLQDDGRPIVSTFVKKKWTLRYGKESGGKIRLDWIVPINPSDPSAKAEGFVDLEFESMGRIDPGPLAKQFLHASGLAYNFRSITSRKLERAQLFDPAPPPSSASSLEDYVRSALRHVQGLT